jgi:hypothetical protein
MSTIIAGHFQLPEQAVLAADALARAGYPGERISRFFVGAAGQQDTSAMLVAVEVGDDHQERRAIDVLRQAGAGPIERSQGHISGSDWHDYDRLAAVHPVGY